MASLGLHNDYVKLYDHKHCNIIECYVKFDMITCRHGIGMFLEFLHKFKWYNFEFSILFKYSIESKCFSILSRFGKIEKLFKTNL